MPYLLARSLYSLLFYFAVPILLFRLWWRGRSASGYRKNWWQRLGFVTHERAYDKPVRPVWIHAVSVGETVAVKPLVDRLLIEHPELPIVMTSMTPTGAARAKALFGDQITHFFCPYDLPCAVRRFLDRVQPQVCLIVETELWPNLIAQCHRYDVPVIVANARLSERSAKGYRKVLSLTQGMLKQISLVMAQNPSDAARFKDLGLLEAQLQVSGSIKFDLKPDPAQILAGEKLKEKLASRKVALLASSHDDEEKQFLEVFRPLQKQHPELLLFIVPRHPERFETVYQQCEKYSSKVFRHSEADSHASNNYQTVEIYLGDTMGDLMSLYTVSDIVVMGGSFVPVGGHNPLEPGLLALPVIMGPHHFNFADISREMAAANALHLVDEMSGARELLEELLQEVNSFTQMGMNAKRYVESRQGAVERIYTALLDKLPG